MAAHLANGRVNVALLREAARRELIELLDKCNGSKAIVWDGSLAGPFSLIAEFGLLRCASRGQRGVTRAAMSSRTPDSVPLPVQSDILTHGRGPLLLSSEGSEDWTLCQLPLKRYS
ncbi:hypothetical protein HPB50_001787 [Hyalomma asiaticum]|uniref:Uncharacterized protein n=1 Tax=Hyalomma asiaticum TaxID=266040 RepID=A0ACB7SDC7_HYAAI|nr:hypothetical protein HPB50_001787 [Hyalomma asiaticum]